MNTDTASAAPQAAALEEQHTFNGSGVCESPDIVVVAELPEHFAAEIRLAHAPDGWRVGFAYAGPPIGVSARGVLPALADAAFSDRDQALAVGVRQLLAGLQAKAKAKKAVAAVMKWAKERGIELSVEGDQSPVDGLPANTAADPAEEPPPAPPTLQVLSIEALAVDGRNPRRTFDEAELHELAESIAANGILQPLVVRARGCMEMDKDLALMSGLLPEFVVVAGERRFRAALLLAKRGVKVPVPCVVYSALSHRQALIIALTENLQRVHMNPIDEAEGFAKLAQLGLTQVEIATIVHKSRSVVANALRLLELPLYVQEVMRVGQLTTAHGVALCRFKAWPNVARRIAELAVDRQDSAAELEEGLPYAETLRGEQLVEQIFVEDFEVEFDTCTRSNRPGEEFLPTALADKPWVFIDRSDGHAFDPDVWALDPLAWQQFCAKLRAEQQAKQEAAAAATPPKAGKAPAPAGEVLDLGKLNHKEWRKVDDLPAAVRKAVSPELIERGNYYSEKNVPVIRGEALALANKLERAATIEKNRDKRAELDAAWQAAVAKIAKIETVDGGHVAQLLEWCCADWQVGRRDDNVTEAAEALKLELPKGLKVIGSGSAEKLSRFTPVQLLRLIFAIRARAAWRVAHRDASPLPDDLKLFGEVPAAKPTKKTSKAKPLKKAA